MVLSTAPKRARDNFETALRRFRCDASAVRDALAIGYEVCRKKNEQGKQSSASARIRKKKGQLIFLPLFYSAVELDWRPVFSVHRQTRSFLFPSNADASGTTRLAAPVSAERFFLFVCFCPTRCRSVAPWQTAGFYFFYFLFFQFTCLVKSDTDKERLGERSWRAV